MTIHPLNRMSQIDDNSQQAKRPRIEEQTISNWQLVISAEPIYNNIIQRLSIKDLLSFEATCKSHQTYTQATWKALRKRDFLAFDWHECDKEVNREKWNYVFGSIFMSILYQHAPSYHPNEEFKNKLHKQLEAVKTHFPSFCYFTSFIENHIFDHSPVDTQQTAGILKNALIGKWGGEILLQSFIQSELAPKPLTQETLNLLSESLTQAIKQKATCASLIALKVLRTNKGLPFALQAAEQGDYRALDYLDLMLSLEKLNQLYHQGFHYPPLLASLANRLAFKDLKRADLLFQQAIQAYGSKVPTRVLSIAALTKINLNQWLEADKLYTQAFLQAYGDQIPATVLANAAFAKLNLNQWLEADKLYAQAIQAFEHPIPTGVLANAALTKLHLKQWLEAEGLYSQAIQAWENPIPAGILANAALAKSKLNHWLEADVLYTQAIQTFEHQVPAWVLANAALVKSKLNHWLEADVLYTQAIQAYGSQVPAYVLENGTFVKSKLEQRN
jgi:Tfp pilus assembly protein PilF